MDGNVALNPVSLTERQLRIDLAAAFRLAAKNDWTEAVANHFSVAVSADGRSFLMNRKWRHFSNIRASELAILDADGGVRVPEDIDTTAWMIHATMHARLPHARCILHLHPPYATAWSCLADPAIKPIDQTSARFFNRVAIDTSFGGMADNAAEGERLAAALSDKSVLMMGNHGVLVVGPTIAHAYDALYHLERACRNLVLAYSTNQKINVLSNDIAEKTALSWEGEDISAQAHFAEMKRILDQQAPDYAQ